MADDNNHANAVEKQLRLAKENVNLPEDLETDNADEADEIDQEDVDDAE